MSSVTPRRTCVARVGCSGFVLTHAQLEAERRSVAVLEAAVARERTRADECRARLAQDANAYSRLQAFRLPEVAAIVSEVRAREVAVCDIRPCVT